jgi:hypothetical protein
VVLADLPEEIGLALADIAGAAREGLLAMSVAAGMAVMVAMFEAEIAASCGPKGIHDPDRAAVRHGGGRGSVTLGGRRAPASTRSPPPGNNGCAPHRRQFRARLVRRPPSTSHG